MSISYSNHCEYPKTQVHPKLSCQMSRAGHQAIKTKASQNVGGGGASGWLSVGAVPERGGVKVTLDIMIIKVTWHLVSIGYGSFLWTVEEGPTRFVTGIIWGGGGGGEVLTPNPGVQPPSPSSILPYAECVVCFIQVHPLP